MKKCLTACLAIIVGACGGEPAHDGSDVESQPTAGSQAATMSTSEAETKLVAPTAELEAMRQQFDVVQMDVDTSFLTDEDVAVVNKLNQFGNLMSEIYFRQRSEKNPEWLAAIESGEFDDQQLLLDLFKLHFGPWDTLDHNKPFFGSEPMPAGAAFYPEDMTKEEFESWLSDHPEDEQAFRSGHTVIRRDGDRLVAIPYSEYYSEWLEPAAALLREASELTSNDSLKKFLRLRADAFLSNDYYESELAWMELDGPIEAAIGPYEVYTDTLFGYKTAFAAFITVKNPDESAALAKYKNFLRNMEANLPVEEQYKNFKRGFESPIVAAYQVHGGGDNVPGVQTIAFNLPNDERVREAKGAKKVILNNVLGAKFDRILLPMASMVLVEEQAGLLMKKYMANGTLFHELSHSLGPGTIEKDGRESSVAAELQELYSAIEEGKADVMGAYNILYMMEEGELPVSEKQEFLATYFVGLFRSMRFGVNEAHGAGAAFQYTYFKKAGAFSWDEDAQRFSLDFDKFEQAIADLTGEIVVLQGNGDYLKAKEFLTSFAVVDEEVEGVIASLTSLPVDIQPVYEDTL